jgi:hypothetical protein
VRRQAGGASGLHRSTSPLVERCQLRRHEGVARAREKARGLNPQKNDSAADRDGDGYSNIEEFLNGTRGS